MLTGSRSDAIHITSIELTFDTIRSSAKKILPLTSIISTIIITALPPNHNVQKACGRNDPQGVSTDHTYRLQLSCEDHSSIYRLFPAILVSLQALQPRAGRL